MLPFGSKSSGGSSGPFAGIEQAMKSGGPMGMMASFYNVPKMAGQPMPQQAAQQAAQAPQNPITMNEIYARLMQHPAYAGYMQQHRPGFMANMAGQPGAPAPQMAQPMPPQMPPAMPQQAASQQAAPQSMAGIAQPGLMQMLMSKFGGQPRVQGLLG